MIRLGVRCPPSLKARAKAAAALEGTTLAELVRDALTIYIELVEEQARGWAPVPEGGDRAG